MPATEIRTFQPFSAPSKPSVRELDDHFHRTMIARDTQELLRWQVELFRVQSLSAAANIRGMQTISSQLDTANHLSAMIFGQLEDLTALAEETLDVLYEQNDILRRGFAEIVAHQVKQQEMLVQIAEILRNPHATESQELFKAAHGYLRAAMESEGRDRDERVRYATARLKDVLSDPIGETHYLAWFEQGWIQWRHGRDLTSAEESFYYAALHSENRTDFHVYCLRHLAYVRYHCGNAPGAYDTIQRAVTAAPQDVDVQYDAARYAAKTGREVEALDRLNWCIDQRPEVIRVMFSEPDFVG